ncbi:amidohydrolase family protein [Biformimicrobium ophioploci]|uniref:Amidohydrolase n=1 Tax=Biformimicrobium ophioploci TaxID=3036711 RepID=A0ABQ6M0Q2_9GAMM|nr:amidohydrolase family protein [Microbulbifer sp. NKW57]GMG87939.1 amidohydrolase [Microbulbifer sp. NKW57]
MKFIDAHHHLWDLDAVHYPWLMEKGQKRFFGDPTPIQKNYLVEDFHAESARFSPSHSVHVQVGAADDIAETRWLEQQQPLPSAIVAHCDLSADNAIEMLEQQAQHPRVRGVRQIVGRHSSEDSANGSGALLENTRWIHNLGVLAEMGMSFDLQMVPEQMPKALEALRQHPNLQVALCHVGSPWDQTEAGLNNWAQGLRELARLPNVSCKISGLGMFNPAWTTDTLRPLVDGVISAFGAERVMFGSNFPVDKLYRGYDELWQAYTTLIETYPEATRQQMLYNTAARFYRIDC